MRLKDMPLSQVLRDRTIFGIFDEEFQKEPWLDLTALLQSESSVTQIYGDDIVPREILDRVIERLDALDDKKYV